MVIVHLVWMWILYRKYGAVNVGKWKGDSCTRFTLWIKTLTWVITRQCEFLGLWSFAISTMAELQRRPKIHVDVWWLLIPSRYLRKICCSWYKCSGSREAHERFSKNKHRKTTNSLHEFRQPLAKTGVLGGQKIRLVWNLNWWPWCSIVSYFYRWRNPSWRTRRFPWRRSRHSTRHLAAAPPACRHRLLRRPGRRLRPRPPGQRRRPPRPRSPAAAVAAGVAPPPWAKPLPPPPQPRPPRLAAAQAEPSASSPRPTSRRRPLRHRPRTSESCSPAPGVRILKGAKCRRWEIYVWF